MKRRHFQTLGPICPACRVQSGAEHPLFLSIEAVADAESVLEGVLQCPAPGCLREYPIIDGIPLLVPDVATYLGSQLAHLRDRDDLSPVIESLLTEGSGPGSHLDVTWNHLGTYAWDHYGEWDRDDPSRGQPKGVRPGSVVRALATGLELCREAGLSIAEGPVLDLGAAAGRASFELTGHTTGLVLGVDLGFHFLKVAARVLGRGRVRYPLRRGGIRYDWREFDVPVSGRERTDFWVCDATRLPFGAGTFGGAVSLNLLDCVYAPLDLLRETARVLRPGAAAIIASPYDWAPAATAVEAWIGGHSPRSLGGGASDQVLRALLTPGGHPASVAGLCLAAERDDVPWTVRLHDRSAVSYRLHLVVATRDPSCSNPARVLPSQP